jgi:aspartyl-tRNA(Asn)/glutamyl-tRNA(Gln) amidotransferase subunit C
MALSESEVRHVAMLARLALTDADVERLRVELNSILGHIDTIQQLDLDGVQPTAHDHRRQLGRTTQTMPAASLLLNAPEAEDGAFAFPQMVGAVILSLRGHCVDLPRTSAPSGGWAFLVVSRCLTATSTLSTR